MNTGILVQAINEIVIENAFALLAYSMVSTLIIIILTIKLAVEKNTAQSVLSGWTLDLKICQFQWVIPESATIRSLQEKVSALELENAALKRTNRIVGVIITVLIGGLLFIMWGKQIIDFFSSMIAKSVKGNSSQEKKPKSPESENKETDPIEGSVFETTEKG